ncbi:M20 metallopeptidase family protein [Crassaminicella profunda]|uniref:M20 metallopeptidase family protein n=1 Tax=Crassaminicella profunda TaxID=1286698 RepID=UPI001CA6FD71|nr:amidohydrolase [Crassaminicella profunda]QZY54122.1 amidohydrolase [Crassaminicella profunda]
MLNEKIHGLVDEIEDWIIDQRRDFHMHPEPSRKEIRTSERVARLLEELGVEVKKGYYNTGVVGIIKGDKEGKTIGLRFDMDALEMEEMNDIPFKSQNEGVMHSCGHDGHTAIGLGIAKVLIQMKDEIHGNIKLVFQPAEEDAPNGGGAQHMIKDGALEEPKVDYMVGAHIWPKLKLGQVGTKSGVLMAASDPFTIDIKGKGIHASLPNMGVDPILIGSQIVTNINTIISRNIDPFEPAVVSIGVFNGGTRYNVIPEEVKLEGTVRSFSEGVREKIHDRLKSVVEETAVALGGNANLHYKFSYPPLMNDEKAVNIAKKSIEELLGEENFVRVNRPEPGGEDFAYFAKEVPSVYMFLGYAEEGKELYAPHNPRFDFNEKVLGIGAKVLIKTALNLGRS